MLPYTFNDEYRFVFFVERYFVYIKQANLKFSLTFNGLKWIRRIFDLILWTDFFTVNHLNLEKKKFCTIYEYLRSIHFEV